MTTQRVAIDVGHKRIKTYMAQSSEHLESARILLTEIPAGLEALQDEYKQCVTNLAVSPKFRVQTQSFLGHLRAALDFLSHEINRFCSRMPARVYFPIAKKGISQKSFEKNLRNKWLPGLEKSRPDLFEYLIKIQYFYPGNEWLPAFHELSNKNKHVKLSIMQIIGCNAAIIRFYGIPVMQIGDRGLGTSRIEAGGTLLFRSNSLEGAIRGPQTLDRNTKQFVDADPGLDIASATWSEFKFDEFPDQPAIVFLEIAERQVRQICSRIEALI